MKNETPKKKLEFMQKVIVALTIISIVFTAASYILAAIGKETCEQLSITIVQTLWCADGAGVLGYAWQNGVRAKWFGDKTANKDEKGI